jgi:hypothetical protein
VTRLWHVSEDPGIERFDPRPPPSKVTGVVFDCVWTVDERHLVNYLLPRDCPRVCYYSLPESRPEDVALLLDGKGERHVVAIEAGWLERARSTALTLYAFAPDDFECVDAGAGYFVARRSQRARGKETVREPLAELAARGAQLVVLDSLHALCDAVVASSLQFSAIRMRNARPR